MQVYDKSKIGKLIALGGDHIVYEYERDKVIKFSLLFYLLGENAFTKGKHEIDVCSKYLDKYFLKTEIYESLNKKHLVHIQPRIVGRKLLKKDLESLEVKKQFIDFINKYNLMNKETGCEIDLVGRGGILVKSLSNLFVTNKNELLLIDATILNFEYLLKILYHPFKKYALWRQNKIIEEFLKFN